MTTKSSLKKRIQSIEESNQALARLNNELFKRLSDMLLELGVNEKEKHQTVLVKIRALVQASNREPLVISFIKPCPYCNSDDIGFQCRESRYWLNCEKCKIQGPEDMSHKMAIACWNQLPRKEEP